MAPAILGAGLSGLLAATQFPSATVYERSPSPQEKHKAVLRFRSDAVGKMVGIGFRKVLVRKAVFDDGLLCEPTIRTMNLYSRKTNGGYYSRSITDCAPVERYIAPDDFYHQLVEIVGNRIVWGYEADESTVKDRGERPLISTLPMPVNLNISALDIAQPSIPFSHAAIQVDRYRVRGADIFQTIYFPDPDETCYRASITGDMLMVERTMPDDKPGARHNINDVLRAFGMDRRDVDVIEANHSQRYGKITPVSEAFRQHAIWSLSQQKGIYSLGRFATWRNILLDDLPQDINVIRRLITQGAYAQTLFRASKELE